MTTTDFDYSSVPDDPRTEEFQAALPQAIEDRLVFANRHPELDLTLYCYSRSAQLELLWNPITEAARGLVIDGDGNVVAWPLRKFHQAKDLDEVPAGTPTVLEKVDGSMLVAFRHDGQLVTNTKGGFTSDQAIAGKALLEAAYDTAAIREDHTYVFEFIHPNNRIVVEYDDTIEVVLLMVRDNRTGDELDVEDLQVVAADIGCRAAQRYDLEHLDPVALAELDWDNAEGFVLLYPSGRRVKVKFATYVQLHGMRTDTPTARRIWEALRRGMPLADVVDNCPDEYDWWVREQATGMLERIDQLRQLTRALYEELGLAELTERKQIAARVFKPWAGEPAAMLEQSGFQASDVRGLLLTLVDGGALATDLRDDLSLPYGVSRTLWRAVKPEADVTPPDSDLLVGISDAA